MKDLSALLPIDTEGNAYHLGLPFEKDTGTPSLPRYGVIVGKPERAVKAAEKFLVSGSVTDHESRGYRVLRGKYKSNIVDLQPLDVSIMSAHMGAPNAGMFLNEAWGCGLRIVMHTHSNSCLFEHAKPGDIVLTTGAVVREGTTLNWVPTGFPAMASYEMCYAQKRVLKELGFDFHEGIQASTDCFYGGQARPMPFSGIVPYHMRALLIEMVAAGVATFSMESSVYFTWAQLANFYSPGLRAGAFGIVYGNRIGDAFNVVGDMRAMEAALETLCWTAAHDPYQERADEGLPFAERTNLVKQIDANQLWERLGVSKEQREHWGLPL